MFVHWKQIDQKMWECIVERWASSRLTRQTDKPTISAKCNDPNSVSDIEQVVSCVNKTQDLSAFLGGWKQRTTLLYLYSCTQKSYKLNLRARVLVIHLCGAVPHTYYGQTEVRYASKFACSYPSSQVNLCPLYQKGNVRDARCAMRTPATFARFFESNLLHRVNEKKKIYWSQQGNELKKDFNLTPKHRSSFSYWYVHRQFWSSRFLEVLLVPCFSQHDGKIVGLKCGR